MKLAPLLTIAWAVLGCSPEDGMPTPVAMQLGTGDGSPGSVRLTLIFEPESMFEATDLAFNPAKNSELWIVHRLHPPHPTCVSIAPGPHCLSVAGSVALIPEADKPLSNWGRFADANAWHFMRRPPAMAFGERGTFATCGEARTGNFDDDLYDFIGPTLFATDLAVFGVEPWEPDMNGTHLDMLHATPFCMGIAHERDHVYWLFNGRDGSLDRYDFHRDHGPGRDDHTDGEIWHYAAGAVTRFPGVPSHMEFNEPTGELYVADTGAGRVIALDPRRARVLDDFEPNYDRVATHVNMTGAVVREVVPPGVLERPGGLALWGNVLFVADHETSHIHAFSLDGRPLRSLDTGLPAATITSIAIGPDERLYFTDGPSGRAYRVDPVDPQ